ncbi:DUF2993 domain-containing protein [Streptomyces gobiensis]|uniref:LmeA family phospholipid-binding protein n=1 Tax=Streptomyces gobiensis TaxID=2875706 RepID=UPI001E410B9B|nr:DUF2993 domain-containing protein [Streptomyces gobiensis]UGY92670.1 DUF2993 domain-containing protein [Streptomyces gobiensis]
MRALRRTVITLIVLAVIFIGADRLALWFAEDFLAGKVTSATASATGSGEGKTQVDIEGFPFLTQVLGKELHEIRISADDTAPANGSGIAVRDIKGTAHGVKITGGFSGAVAEQVEGTATVTYASIARALDGDTGKTEIAPVTGGPDRIRITRDGMHVIARISTDGNTIRITPETEGAPEQNISLTGIPWGITAKTVQATDDGIKVSFAGNGVTLAG